ncbi:MAG: hypothetical protein C6I00_01040 [Nitratiruptor sp.]|nr:hypothetical protein [Nitratiruptor sp.]NPA83182.1 DUF234 domain-containing protein [Campylobacterota bacterium]
MEETRIKGAFQKFYRNFPRQEIERAIELFACFGLSQPLFTPDLSKDLIDNISLLLDAYPTIKGQLAPHNEHLLWAFATGDRKIENTLKKSFASSTLAHQALQELIEADLLHKIPSREHYPPRSKGRKRKRRERRYRIQHKIAFSRPFYRFWYRYIYPNEALILSGEGDRLVSLILDDLEHFVSLFFEELSNELLKERFQNHRSSGSYWDRQVELDLYLELADGGAVVGECKWKNSKVCKQTLNSLKKRAAIAGIEPTFYALFSKSGFSNELLNSQCPQLLLFDLEDFKEWSDQEVHRKREKRPYSFEF